MALNPSPQRQSVVTFPTPNVNDILFFESVDAERVGTEIPEYGSKHPDYKKWPDHRLVHVETADDQTRYYRYYYAADQLNQDDDNWSFTKADIGGTKFDAVARDYVVRRTEFSSTSPEMGSTMPDTPAGKFSGTHVLVERQQMPIDNKVLNGLYVIERRVYAKKIPLKRLDYDEFFNTTNYTTQTLVHKDELAPDGGGETMATLVNGADGAYSAYWEVSSDGILKTAKQLSDQWYLLTEQQVVNTGGGSSASTALFRTINYDWPPVLDDVVFDTWPLRSGGQRTFPRVTYTRGPYRGPCNATVTRTWSKTAPITGGEVDPTMQPEPIAFTTPYFRVNVPPTLHVARNFTGTNGSEDETFERVDWSYDKGQTNYTDWPATLKISSEVKPFRGGWLHETVVVQRPTTTVP